MIDDPDEKRAASITIELFKLFTTRKTRGEKIMPAVDDATNRRSYRPYAVQQRGTPHDVNTKYERKKEKRCGTYRRDTRTK